MTEFRGLVGFEDSWRQALPGMIRARPTRLGAAGYGGQGRPNPAAPYSRQVVATVTGRMLAGPQLHAHLRYVSRNGELPLESAQGLRIEGAEALKELADDWAWGAATDSHRMSTMPISRSLVLSMAPDVEGEKLEAAARTFASKTLGETFDYAFVRHADSPNPHVHLVVRALGADGERFTPMKRDLWLWRETFAAALRDQGVEAEASSRHSRGVDTKSEPSRLRHARLKYERGDGPMPQVTRNSLQRARLEAALDAWEESILARSRRQTHAQDPNAEPTAGWKSGARGQGDKPQIETSNAKAQRDAVPGEAPPPGILPTFQRWRERDARGEEHERGR